jgi:hypothetical protein
MARTTKYGAWQKSKVSWIFSNRYRTQGVERTEVKGIFKCLMIPKALKIKEKQEQKNLQIAFHFFKQQLLILKLMSMKVLNSASATSTTLKLA